jgi:hypothetical protein
MKMNNNCRRAARKTERPCNSFWRSVWKILIKELILLLGRGLAVALAAFLRSALAILFGN